MYWGANRKPGSKSQFFGSLPYFYFLFCLYGPADGRFCLIFARMAQQLPPCELWSTLRFDFFGRPDPDLTREHYSPAGPEKNGCKIVYFGPLFILIHWGL